jgi:hypothetical protein
MRSQRHRPRPPEADEIAAGTPSPQHRAENVSRERREAAEEGIVRRVRRLRALRGWSGCHGAMISLPTAAFQEAEIADAARSAIDSARDA